MFRTVVMLPMMMIMMTIACVVLVTVSLILLPALLLSSSSPLDSDYLSKSGFALVHDKHKHNNNNNNLRKSTTAVMRQQHQLQRQQPTSLSSVALCIRGQDRFVDNAQNYKQYIVDPLQADVFLAMHGANADQLNLANVLRPVATNYTDYVVDDIFAELERGGFNKTYWQQALGTNSGTNGLSPLLGTRGGAFFQYKAMKDCYDLITDYENTHRGGIPYPWVGMIRTDHWCLGQPFPSLDDLLHNENHEAAVYIPAGMDWGRGWNDLMIVMSRNLANQVMTGTWNKLRTNTHANDLLQNVEYAHKQNVLQALDNASTTTASIKNDNAIRRPAPKCFLACVPDVSPTSWSGCYTTTADYHQMPLAVPGFKVHSELGDVLFYAAAVDAAHLEE